MPYLGNQHIVGDSVNNFKVLDDISTYTATFDGSASSVVSTTAHTIKLATSASDAASLTAINLNAVGGGTSHTLNAAFDGVNKKFRITHSNGNRPRFHHATQLNIAINNVIQRPNDSLTFTEGYAVEVRDIIVFKTAPTVNDIFFGSLTGETRGTFDIQDNVVDYHTADGSTLVYNLSQPAPNSQSLLVSLNGVVQHPTSDGVTRSYELTAGSNTIVFSVAPAAGVEIQIRHLGFAGATSSAVTGFYGRTGNVGLTSTDNITTGNINAQNIVATGIATFGSSSTVIDGDANTIKVGTALTLGHTQGLQFHTQNLHSAGFEINQINASGIITASSFSGDGSSLTGVTQSDTPLASSTQSTVFYESDDETTVSTDTTLSRSSSNSGVIYTKFQQVVVAPTKSLIVAAGETLVVDAYGFRTPDI